VADVTLLTITISTTARSQLEEAVAGLENPINVRFVDQPAWMAALLRFRVLGMIKYCAWQAQAAWVLRRFERHNNVDAAHHVSWASDSLPSALLASRAPLRVWGPVGGCTRTTPGLYRYLTTAGKAGEVVRDVMNGALRLTTGRWLARHATLVVALNDDVERYWSRLSTPVAVESNTVLRPEELETASASPTGDQHPEPCDGYRVAVFVARLIPWKGLLLAVESLSHAPGWKLVVLGDGPDRERAWALAQRIGVGDRLEFRGNVPRQEVFAAFRMADALLFPSFHDSAPWSVGEASSLGCPVICLDAGGPSRQAGRNAHVVPRRPEKSLAERIGEALRSLPGRGSPDDHLSADRLPGILSDWYSRRSDRVAAEVDELPAATRSG
jgi:glycosyltransferase involved in cell wall biosynthesis